MDPRTAAYLRELNQKLSRQIGDAVQTAEELCQCPDCIKSRELKQMSSCDNAKLMHDIHDKIIGSMPGNLVPELGRNYFLFKSGKRRAF